jgi:hypothetical protein
MVGGAWGGIFIRWGVGYVFHGYCFGYCTYVLAFKPLFLKYRLMIKQKYPALFEE